MKAPGLKYKNWKSLESHEQDNTDHANLLVLNRVRFPANEAVGSTFQALIRLSVTQIAYFFLQSLSTVSFGYTPI